MNPQDSSLVFSKGYTLMVMKDYDKAIPIIEKAIDLNYQPAQNARFALARAYAAVNNESKSLENLKASAEGGFASFPSFDSIQFKSIKDTATFNSIRKQVKSNAFPCLKDSNNNKFDFWLGEWDVIVGGVKRADSFISKAKGGCAVHEDYRVLSGVYSGQSISFYEPNDKKWHQYWVGSGGDKSIYYETEDYEGNLQFITKSPSPNGGETWIRMTYIAVDENTVHQNLDNSSDLGKTWTPGFRGVYKRK